MNQNGNYELDEIDFIRNQAPDMLDESDAYLYEKMIQNIDQENKQSKPKLSAENGKFDAKPQKISEYYHNFQKKHSKNQTKKTNNKNKVQKGIANSYKKLSSVKNTSKDR